MKLNRTPTPPPPLFRAAYDQNQFEAEFAACLYSNLLSRIQFYDIVIVCVGTDRSTGDALGPLIGSKLNKLYPKPLHVYGTLDEPVHAVNLGETLQRINQQHTQPYMIAIDACLGDQEHVGTVSLGRGGLKPGAAVNKRLPEVGHLHVTGIVNIAGFMEYFVLQNTRLSLVMNMSDKIASAFYYASLDLKHQSNKSKGPHGSYISKDRIPHTFPEL